MGVARCISQEWAADSGDLRRKSSFSMGNSSDERAKGVP